MSVSNGATQPSKDGGGRRRAASKPKSSAQFCRGIVKRRRGNIEATDGPDPFPKTGWTKQFEPFIRRWVADFCQDYPGADYENYLVDAVQIAVELEPKYDQQRGSFATFIWKPLLRLTRIYQNEKNQIKAPAQTREEYERDEDTGEPINPILYRGGNGTRITIDRQWMVDGSRHRVVIGTQLRTRDEKDARAVIDKASSFIAKLLDDRPINAIRLSIQDELGKGVDVQFYKGREPPNFYKWPAQVICVSWADYVVDDGDGNALSFQEVVAGSDPRGIPNGDADVNKLRRAIVAELPFLSPNERKVLEWKMDVAGGRLTHWAARNGISKGYASKLNDRLTERLAKRMKEQQ